MTWLDTALERASPSAAVDLTPFGLTLAAVCAAALVLVEPVWLRVRLAVTLAHELGHAAAGVAVGRRFTGFVVRADMSGHAVTVGPARGAGAAATVWAGYPAPAVLGAAMGSAGGLGWSGPLLAAVLVVLGFAVIRVRSLVTALVVLRTGVVVAVLWWWPTSATAYILFGLGVFLLLGAWRHLLVLMRSRSSQDDATALTRLTGVPRLAWLASFTAIIGLCSWLTGSALLGRV